MAPTSWKVENSGSTPARLAMASAKTDYDAISVSAKANGSTLLDYSGGFASYDPTLIVPAKGSLDVSWAVSRLDPTARRPVRASIPAPGDVAFGILSLLHPVDRA